MSVILCSYGRMGVGRGSHKNPCPLDILWMLVVTATLVSTAVSDDDEETLSQTRLEVGTEN